MSAVVVLVSALAVGSACGSAQDDIVSSPVAAPESTSEATTTSTGEVVVPPDSAVVESATSTTSSAPTTSTSTTPDPSTTTSPATSTTLPGTPFEPMYTPAGAELGAIAVRFDETLDVRSLPGAGQPILTSLPPLATGIVATGRAQRVDQESWLEVTAAGVTGWAPYHHLRYIGGERDATSTFVRLLGGTPTAPSMLELGLLVAGAIASTDPEVTSRVVPVVAPTSGATATVTYDVVGFPDDSVAGQRLAVTGRQVPTASLPATAFAASTRYELVRVDATLICWRGVTPDGICV